MFRDACGELSSSSFHVEFDEKVSPQVTMTKIEPWLKPNGPRINGQLHRLDAIYAWECGWDAIVVTFDCKPWFGEAILDREQAGALLAKLTEAIADYDREEPARQRDPATHHLTK
jgi:hypothetical protein